MEPSNNINTSTTNNYLLVINGKPEGPFTLDQLKAFNIRPGDFVKTLAMDDYKEAHEIAEFRSFFGFNQQALIPQYFGSFDQRLLAAALDWFFVAGAVIIVVFIASLLVNNPVVRLSLALGSLAIIPIIKLGYNIILESSTKQATYGKQILNIKVCDLQGKRISTGRSAGRNFAKLFSVSTLFIGYLFSFFNKQQQCLHDMIAGTLVMKDRLL